MRKFTGVIAVLLGGILFQWGDALQAQEKGGDAKKQHERALKKKDDNKKIDALQKTLEADPDNIAALLELATIYQQKTNFKRAEIYLNRAHKSAFPGSGARTQYKVLFQLAKLHSKVGNANLALQFFQQARNLNVDKSLLSRTRFESGRILYNQGRYDEAIVELQAGRAYNAGDRSYFDNLLSMTKAAQELQKLYDAAMQKIESQDLYGAKALLLQISQKKPDFRNVTERLAEIDAILKEQLETRRAAAQNERLKKHEKPPVFVSKAVSDSTQNLVGQDGVQDSAKVADAVVPQKSPSSVSSIPDTLVASADSSSGFIPELASEGEEILENASPNLEQDETTATEAYLDSLYLGALAFQDDDKWRESLANLEIIVSHDTAFRDVNALMETAKSNFNDAYSSEIEKHPEQSTGFDGWILRGGVIAGVMIPLIIFAAFSPVARAKLYTMRGNYHAAALIYEKAMERNPGNLKLYAALANLYLLSGREDIEAMKIYKTVLKLKLETRRFAEINTIVTNSYLGAGKPDNEAILVLEDALKKEMAERRTES